MTSIGQFFDMTRTIGRALRMKPPERDERISLGAMLTRNAERFPEREALVCEGETLTWGQFNDRANRMAHHLANHHGIGVGDCVAMMLENRVEFLVTLFGILKLGAIAGLINTNQRRDVLIHSAGIIDARAFVVGAELIEALEDEVREALPLQDGSDYVFVPDGDDIAAPNWAHRFDSRDADTPTEEPAQTAEITAGQPCFYVFTSGTTGMPKAARMSHERALRGIQGYGVVCLDIRPEDRVYNTLPLYHSTGLVIGFGSVLHAGANMFIRRRFSASNFWPEVRAHRSNAFVYVGELCRYLINQAPQPDDADNPIEKVIGNGLRPDIWMEFKRRFAIDRVMEIYGASEGNSGFVNAFNKDRTIGFGISPHVLVRYDVDNDEIVRGADGRCQVVEKGQPGLLLNQIDEKDAPFEGYTDKEATEKKIVRDVLEPGDAYFNTGDLVKQIDVGFAFGRAHYQFVDRTGDTFRWKGENCSTNEVGEVINDFVQVQTTNVYGVSIPGADGKAGMAAISFDPDQVAGPEDIDWDGLTRHINDKLPSYARPVFIRVQQQQDTTSTFKLLKKTLREQGYDPAATEGDAIFVMKPGSTTYELLDEAFLAAIRAGNGGY